MLPYGRTLSAFIVAVLLASAVLLGQGSWLEPYRTVTPRIVDEATSAGSAAWTRLAVLTDTFPARLSGSSSLERSIRWVADVMMRDGLENVRIEKVMVPHWVRGAERAEIVSSPPQHIAISALGGTVGTGPAGVRAQVLVVRDFADLDSQASRAMGKIVVYNFPFKSNIDPLIAYQEATPYRRTGASRAAAHGAVAALVRSVGPIGYRTVHTGNMTYAGNAPRIPVAAIAAEDADKLQRIQDRGESVEVNLSLGAETLPDVESGNVVAELLGTEKPDEIVLLGAHLDSWDLAAGALDDGGGCVAIWEAVRVLKKLGLRPRRTIRLVLFTNEENGNRGGQAYRDTYSRQLSQHVLMLESDNGALPLKGFGFSGTNQARAVVVEIAGLLKELGIKEISDGFDGVDIRPAVQAGGIPAISPQVDMTKYFAVHHTSADTIDKVSPEDLGRLVVAIASMAYVIADMPQALDRAGRGPAQ